MLIDKMPLSSIVRSPEIVSEGSFPSWELARIGMAISRAPRIVRRYLETLTAATVAANGKPDDQDAREESVG
jgi:hypothetical protein